jgi:hypothetical protein
MSHRHALVLISALLGLIPPTARAEDPMEAAIRVAREWLKGVDAGEYAKSWRDAAPVFQAAVSEDKWVAMVASVRDPLGKVESRQVVNAQFTKSLPNAPAGEYFVLQFQTAFANKPEAVETVTPMKTATGWRVSGYFIK